MYFHMLDVKF